MNKNKMTLTFVVVEVPNGYYKCGECDLHGLCYEKCEPRERKDGRNVVFKLKETK